MQTGCDQIVWLHSVGMAYSPTSLQRVFRKLDLYYLIYKSFKDYLIYSYVCMSLRFESLSHRTRTVERNSKYFA
jgi:hypothetical protein